MRGCSSCEKGSAFPRFTIRSALFVGDIRDSWVKVAQHIAMKGNLKPGEVHREWRIENNMPGDYRNMGEVMRIVPKIMQIFGWRDLLPKTTGMRFKQRCSGP